MIDKQLNIALDRYMSWFYPEEDDDNKYAYIDAVEDVIDSDLTNACFDYAEIAQIISKQLNKETAYKFMAYFISLFDGYLNADKLKKCIEEHPDLNLEEFTDEDIDKILLASQKLC